MFFRYNKWALLWAALIFILCMIPGSDLPKISWLEILGFDKFVHAGLFFVLMIFFVRGFLLQQTFSLLKSSPMISSVVICVTYGGALELMQDAIFVERTADIYDFIANSFGSIMGLIFFRKMDEKILFKFIR